AKKHTVKGRVTKSSETKAVASASPAKGGYYLVRDGDTAEKIASARGISVGTLLTANHLPQGGRLLPGQRVYVPGN
ncbi:LysM peptidoglycan-binding domain-containing protein, partial [Candidatus Sumerlaeota bacterium]|nr:LysM peptidoglycan-binding domain-containing protein [Candidatus Sumerlaeota bacterium]